MVVESDVKWRLTFSHVLEFAYGAFEQIDDKHAFTICVMVHFEDLIGSGTVKCCSLTDLFTTQVVWSRSAWLTSFFTILTFTNH